MARNRKYDALNSQSLRRAITAAVLAVSAPAMAWGPTTQESVVSAAGHIYSENSPVPLANLMNYIREGARIDEATQRELFLDYEVAPVQTIQREMFLLQGVRTDRIDPYFAYRLGALGKLVVQHVAPMRDEDQGVRGQYFADVERAVSRVKLTGSTRNLVDPGSYFPVINRDAQTNNGTIKVDYSSGVGFSGVAGSNLSRDISRAVDCVADVWFTIFQSNVEFIDISRGDMRDYMLDSIEFYLKTGNVNEVNGVYERAKQKNLLDADMKQRVGNYYYDNGYFEEALVVYEELLAENPRIPEVNRRISDYYVSLGKRALNRSNIDEAQVSFQNAVEADKLNEDAQRQLVTASRAIEKREARKLEQQGYVEAAERSMLEAEDATRGTEYAYAIKLLEEAGDNFGKVTTEFSELNTTASVGRTRVRIRIEEVRKEFYERLPRESGSGFAYDARLLAGSSGDLMTPTLRSMQEANYQAAIEAVANSLTVD